MKKFLLLTVSILCLCQASQAQEPVDLGLSVLWADRNMGATLPSDYGARFAWGETFTKNEYTLQTYTYYKDGNYIDIGNNISGTSYDPATVHFGNGWRMPTLDEIRELVKYCDRRFGKLNGILVTQFKSPITGNAIYLPITQTNDTGYYWTGTLDTWSGFGKSSAYALWFDDLFCLTDNSYLREGGYRIRPVKDANSAGLNDVITGQEIISTEIYTLQGVRIDETNLSSGCYIRVDKYSNGQVSTSKFIVD